MPTIKGDRYDEIRNVLDDRDDVIKVELDEDWLPPHKMAGHVPYDVIIHLDPPLYSNETEWTEELVQSMLISHGLPCVEVLNVEPEGGHVIALVSVHTLQEVRDRT